MPFQVPSPHSNYIEDLGVKFTETELVDAVFNENFSVEVSASSKTINVKPIDPNDNEGEFKIYALDIAHDVEINSFTSSAGYKGTILQIPVEHIVAKPSVENPDDTCDTYYFRFRIKELSLDFLIHRYTPPYTALQSIFNTTYMIDFRYHNVRSLDKSLVERFYESGHHIVNVTAVHFLLITKAYVNVFGEHFKSTRKIERQVWKEYVNGNNMEDLVAYHHVDRPKPKPASPEEPTYVSSGEMFARLQVEKSVLLPYIVSALIIGAFASVIATALLHFLPW